MEEHFSLDFHGGLASRGQLNFYDAAAAQEGFARVLLIAGHFAATGKIIHKAPFSEAEVRVLAPRRGSFLITVATIVGTAVVTASVGEVVRRLFDRALPQHNEAMAKVHEELKEQNRLKRIELGLEPLPWAAIEAQHDPLKSFHREIETIRGITAGALEKTFRPVGRSAGHAVVGVGDLREPIRAVDQEMVSRLKVDEPDKDASITTGIVNNFSKSTQTGFVWDDRLGRRIRFKFDGGQLSAGNDLSWSLHEQAPIELTGKYVRWVDGEVKKLLIRGTRRIETRDRFDPD